MFKGMRLGYLAGAAVAAIAVAGSVSFAAKTPPVEDDGSVYRPIESISYVFGSKQASGYFVRDLNKCEVALMIAEVIDPETQDPQSAARLRVALVPGQATSIDSNEGRSIELTCGRDAETMTVRESEWRSGYRPVQ